MAEEYGGLWGFVRREQLLLQMLRLAPGSVQSAHRRVTSQVARER
jgi:hypothetical protein